VLLDELNEQVQGAIERTSDDAVGEQPSETKVPGMLADPPKEQADEFEGEVHERKGDRVIGIVGNPVDELAARKHGCSQFRATKLLDHETVENQQYDDIFQNKDGEELVRVEEVETEPAIAEILLGRVLRVAGVSEA
jgi:hypothetical protein